MEKLHQITISNNFRYDMAEVVSFLKIHNEICSEMDLADKDYEFIEKNENGIILHAFVGSIEKHRKMILLHLETFFKGLGSPKIEYKLL